jgi:serine/threonine protein kinase/formylglycine-generating enzyme required for sulfatase activity
LWVQADLSVKDFIATPRGFLADRWSPPPSFDEYRLVRPLGGGSGGTVYLAHDTLLDRPVSVKFLRALDERSLSNFLLEARATARLQHPNVVTLYRVGQLGNRPYLVSEYVRGLSLDRIEKPVSWDATLSFALDLCRGLSAAHRCGVLHRDLKPANAVLTETGEVKLLDFGLAKLVGPGPAPDPSTPVPAMDRERALVRHAPRPEPTAATATAEPGPPPPAGGEGDPLAETFTSPQGRPIVGTPYYMAPEVWRGEGATVRSDLYSLGALLYELCSGAAPNRDLSLTSLGDAIQERDVPPLQEAAPGAHPAFAALVDRCLRRDPVERFASVDDLLDALEALASASDHSPLPEGNPYRGLQPFEAEHRALFFGRRRSVAAVLERLRVESLLVLAGDSGTGKSSLCLAGVLPEVAEGALKDGRTWRSVRMVPGRSPVTGLASALAEATGSAETALERLIRESPQAFARSLRAQIGAGRGLLIYVDQLEELITLSSPESARVVASALEPLAAGVPGIRLLATARSDFLTRLAALPGLGDHLPRSIFLVRALSSEETREAIVGPARAKGGRFESEALVDALVQAATSTDGGLPLLQFTLAELWEARDQATRIISAASLESIGGVQGALARHAELVLASLLHDERQAARTLLLRLVTAEGTRARRSEAELVQLHPHARAALEALVRGRLVVARENDGGAIYEIAHEALLEGCATLAGWLGEEAETRAVRDRLSLAAAEWERRGRDAEALWGARALAEARGIPDAALAPRERQFLESSRAAGRRARLLRRGLIAGAVAALVAVAAGINALATADQQRALTRQLLLARAELDRAHAGGDLAGTLRREAMRLFRSGDLGGGEQLWSRARSEEAQAEQAYGRATNALEYAVVLGASRDDLRRELGAVWLERATMADRAHRTDLRDLFVERMEATDPDGDYRRRWRAPASMTISSRPPGARVEVHRYQRGHDGRYEVVPVEGSAVTPATLTLPPGSYLLTLSMPGRVTTRYPVLLERGESTSASVPLLQPDQVPPGYVYVPGGRFLFGSGDEDSVRQFFNTVPLHQEEGAPYFIARHETTFAEWIRFLQDLPPAERAQRLPHVGASGLHGSLRLIPPPVTSASAGGAAGWRLEMQPGKSAYRAVAGARLRYAARQHHAEQDWLKFPVIGISWDDAEAYASWLRQSGRVPGARPCTELEWERAARGADARQYPHGDRLDPEDANFDLTYGKEPLAFGPDEVGSHPRSQSPFGVEDLSGNVWEWVASSLTPGTPLLRGGAYYFAATSARVTNRELPEAAARDLTVGVRVCASAPF